MKIRDECQPSSGTDFWSLESLMDVAELQPTDTTLTPDILVADLVAYWLRGASGRPMVANLDAVGYLVPDTLTA